MTIFEQGFSGPFERGRVERIHPSHLAKHVIVPKSTAKIRRTALWHTIRLLITVCGTVGTTVANVGPGHPVGEEQLGAQRVGQAGRSHDRPSQSGNSTKCSAGTSVKAGPDKAPHTDGKYRKSVAFASRMKCTFHKYRNPDTPSIDSWRALKALLKDTIWKQD